MDESTFDPPPPKPKRAYKKRVKVSDPPPPTPITPSVIEAALEHIEPEVPVRVDDLAPGVEVITASGDGIEQLEAPRAEFAAAEYVTAAEPDAPPPPHPSCPAAPAYMAEPAYIPPHEPDPKRREVITKLTRYRESFAAFKTMVIDRNATTEALQSQLDEVRAVVSCRNLSAMVKAGYLVSTKGLEVVMSKGGAKVYGLSDLLSKSPEIDAILTEIAIETAPVQGLSPMHRLAFCTLASAVALDSLNRANERNAVKAAGTPSDDLLNAARSL